MDTGSTKVIPLFLEMGRLTVVVATHQGLGTCSVPFRGRWGPDVGQVKVCRREGLNKGKTVGVGGMKRLVVGVKDKEVFRSSVDCTRRIADEGRER